MCELTPELVHSVSPGCCAPVSGRSAVQSCFPFTLTPGRPAALCRLPFSAPVRFFILSFRFRGSRGGQSGAACAPGGVGMEGGRLRSSHFATCGRAPHLRLCSHPFMVALFAVAPRGWHDARCEKCLPVLLPFRPSLAAQRSLAPRPLVPLCGGRAQSAAAARRRGRGCETARRPPHLRSSCATPLGCSASARPLSLSRNGRC